MNVGFVIDGKVVVPCTSDTVLWNHRTSAMELMRHEGMEVKSALWKFRCASDPG